MTEEYITTQYKLIRLLFQHDGKSTERVVRKYIQDMILKKKVAALGISTQVNDREDVRISLEGAKVSFSSPGNEKVPPAQVTGYLVDLSAGGACIKIPSKVKLHKKAPAFISLDFIEPGLEIRCDVLGLR